MEIITAEEAAEAAKGLTFEIVWAALMENRLQLQETRKQFEEQNREWQKRMEESQKLATEESQKRMEESRKLADESHQKLEKSIAEVNRQLGGLGNSIGELTESMFSGALWSKFSEYGITVGSQSARKRFSDGDRVIAEADIFIENGEYAIPVEVKTRLTEKSVDGHIERIEVIRRYFDDKGDKRKLLGAVAGGMVTENMLKYAQDKGLFVLVQSGDSVTIADTPQGFKPREW